MLVLFQNVLQLSLTATFLALGVMALRLIFPRCPKWVRCLLWGVVALRLLCPVTMESPLSLVPAQIASGQVVEQVTKLDPTYVVQTEPLYIDSVAPEHLESIPVPDDTDYFQYPLQSPTLEQTKPPILPALWAFGMALMLHYAGFSWLRLRLSLREATLLRENIWQCETVDSPFVLGIFRPRIYLPYFLSPEDAAHVIAHEQAHIHRKDHWWKPLGFLLLSAHWFNPVLWLSYILLCRDIEAACDERVIRNMEKSEKQAYSTALLNCSIHKRTVAACPLAFGETGVKERVKNVMHYKKPGFWILLTALILSLVIAVCFLTDPLADVEGDMTVIHSQSYTIPDCVYHNNALHYTKTNPAALLRFHVREDMHLLVKYQQVSDSPAMDLGLEEGEWVDLGDMESCDLDKENFDGLCHLGNGGGSTIRRIRENAENAWKLLTDQEELIYLIQCSDGELYLALGDRNAGREPDPVIRYVYSMELDGTQNIGICAKSGNHTAAVTVFPAGTPIDNYSMMVQWLTINPGEDFAPFRVYQNGKEVIGHYLAYDAETMEQLPYMVPTGLDPQTYLFQHADPNRHYIVVMRPTAEPDADIWCFGVSFEAETHAVLKGQILDIQDGFFYVRPVAGSVELEISQLFRIPMVHMDSAKEPLVGDVITVHYEGIVEDSYPAELEEVYAIYLAEIAQQKKWYAVMPNSEPLVGSIEIQGRGIDAVISKSNGESYQPGETVWLDPMEGISDLRGMSITVKDHRGKVLFQVEYPENGNQEITWIEGYCRIGSTVDPAPEIIVMQPADSKMTGIFDRYLFLQFGGKNYRYERQETMPGGIQAGEEIGVVYEDSGLGHRYAYTVFRVKNCIDDTLMLVHSKDMDSMWLYRYSPAKATDANALNGAIEQGCVIMEDSSAAYNQQNWLQFWASVQQGKGASVELGYYFTLDPSTCSDQYYEAYREDYPNLHRYTLYYNGTFFNLHNHETGEVQSYEYLNHYTGTYPNTSVTYDQYILTHSATVTWEELFHGLISSAYGAYIDHYTVYSEVND